MALRIKKDVDLKELEKFGYTYSIIFPLGNGYVKDLDYGDFISINNDRIISFEIEDYCGNDFEKDNKKYIQDLIQAGLVEKVSEGDNE